MKKILLYLLLIVPLVGCSTDFYIAPDPPYPPPPTETITYIRDGGPYGNITSVVVNNEIRANSYYGPTVAVQDGDFIYENTVYGRSLAFINGNYILDRPNGVIIAFIDGPYILDAPPPYGRVMAFMDSNPDNVAGALGAVYMLLFY